MITILGDVSRAQVGWAAPGTNTVIAVTAANNVITGSLFPWEPQDVSPYEPPPES
jgi:hypothetical protein